jgi:hypothetical protein
LSLNKLNFLIYNVKIKNKVLFKPKAYLERVLIN